jgi:hypothetical protein
VDLRHDIIAWLLRLFSVEAGTMIKKVVAPRRARKKARVPSAQVLNWKDFRPAMLGANDHLATELVTYRDNLGTLLINRDKFVVIKGAKILGVHKTLESAMKVAIQFAPVPVLVKKIVESEPVVHLGHVAY